MGITFGGIEGRQFVITGGAGGIGQACAAQVLGAGGHVMIVDVDAGRLQEARERLGGGSRLSIHTSNLGSAREAADCLDAAGRSIYALIHMAGLFEPDPLDPSDHSAYDRAMASNLHNAYDLAVAYQSRRDPSTVGRLVFCSSGAFRRGSPGRVAYCVAKAGVVGLTRALSRQFAPHTLVNAVAPNAIRTQMTQSVFRERGEAIMSIIPLGRFGEAEEIASVVSFLCSDGATYITGQTINIDGGAANS